MRVENVKHAKDSTLKTQAVTALQCYSSKTILQKSNFNSIFIYINIGFILM